MKQKKAASMRARLTGQFLMFLFGVFIVYAVMFSAMGIIDKITTNNYKILVSQTQNTAGQIAEVFREVTLATDDLAEFTEKEIVGYQNETGTDWKDVDGNNEALDAVYRRIAKYYLEAVMRGHTTGVFVLLAAVYSGENSSDYMSALYIRNSSPQSVGSISYSSLMQYKGSTRILSEAADDNNIALDQFYMPYYPKNAAKGGNPEQILAPMRETSRPGGNAVRADYGSWSGIYAHETGDRKIITYSQPLYDRAGNIIGVCGFELSADYIISKIPNTNLPYADSAYVLANLRGDGVKSFSEQAMLINGLPQSKLLGDSGNGELVPDSYALNGDMNVYGVSGAGYTAFPVDLEIYGEKSVYYYGENGYFLIGCVGTEELYRLGGAVNTLNFITIIVIFILLGVGLLFFGDNISSMIKKLDAQVSSLDAGGHVKFERVKIKEIDHLARSFEEMSVRLIKNARHLSDVAELVGFTVAAVEVNAGSGTASFSGILYDVFNVERDSEVPSERGARSVLPVNEWEEKFPMFMKLGVLTGRLRETACAETGGFLDDEFEFNGKWYRVRYIYDADNNSFYATMIEITKEIEDRRKFEFERDYDSLTGILNRYSYITKIRQKILDAPEAVGAAIFCDLDNLKYVNDTYGHKAGDIYIQTAAAALAGFEKYGGVVARIAGDEFVVYLHGYASKAEVSAVIKAEMEAVKNARADISADIEENKVQLSSGVAFYPDDSTVPDDLIKYADFAMNELKRSSKGGIRNFDADSYSRNAYLAEKQDYLDIFIEKKRLRFAFQPIVEVRTGELYGFQALMRPLIREIQSPEMLINIAKAQSRLYEVENLIIEKLFEWIKENAPAIGGKMIYFNVMGTQNCLPEEWDKFAALNREHFSSVVCEITELSTEEIDKIVTKADRFRENGAEIALDGLCGENEMLLLKPGVVKIDRKIVRGIDADESKRRSFEAAAAFAKNNGAKIIAEGVESEEELDMAVRLGADYVHGFAVGMPSYEILDVSDKVKNQIRKTRDKYN